MKLDFKFLKICVIIISVCRTYLIQFIGNVGENDALAEVVQNWSRSLKKLSTKDLLNVRIFHEFFVQFFL